MRKSSLALLLLALPFAAFAQVDDDTITVTASRSTNLQPDEVVVGVNVSTTPDLSLDDIVGLLTGTGITAANLSSASTTTYLYAGQPQQLSSQWYFAINVPISNVTTLLGSLVKLQQKLAPPAGKLSVSYNIQTVQVSQQLLDANPCAYTTLVSDAQRQAQTLAAAAGVGVGPVVAIGNSPGVQLAAVPAVRSGDYSSLVGAVYDPLTGAASSAYQWFAPAAAPSCSMTVSFQLKR